MAVTASSKGSSLTQSNAPVVATTCSIQVLSVAVTAARANRPVWPRPTKAGVLGMARTTRWVPSQLAMLSLRMPAATLRCRALAQKSRVCWAASLKVCGFTAQITKPASAKVASAAAKTRTPNWACRRWRASSKGSTTKMRLAGVPC